MKQVTFIDQAQIKIKAGKGGDGKMGFHKEKYIEHGGPSGGNGGNGGSIFLIATNNENTLLKYKGRSQYKGNDGTNGGLKNMTGARGEDIFLPVPVGTEVKENNEKVADLLFNGQIWLASQGGQGGRGNKSFKSAKNTTPTLFEYGVQPEWRELELNLKVLADVGLLGYPNAGKSTLVSSITNAKPKVADYEFTTLVPQLGIVNVKNGKDFLITDLPGLIEGASENKGMGITFLKHLSRTKLILHLIDATSDNILEKYNNLRQELKAYSDNLFNRTEVIVFSKIDLIDEKIKKEILNTFIDKETLFISSFTRDGLDELISSISKQLIIIDEAERKTFEKLESDESEIEVFKLNEEEDPLEIEEQDGVWTISNKFVHYWANRIPLVNQENIFRIFQKLKTKGIIDQLEKKGIKSGDMLIIKNSPFVFEYNKK